MCLLNQPPCSQALSGGLFAPGAAWGGDGAYQLGSGKVGSCVFTLACLAANALSEVPPSLTVAPDDPTWSKSGEEGAVFHAGAPEQSGGGCFSRGAPKQSGVVWRGGGCFSRRAVERIGEEGAIFHAGCRAERIGEEGAVFHVRL